MNSGLGSRIRLVELENNSNEDILDSSSDFLYPDRYRNLHGNPGSEVIYDSSQFGEIYLRMAVTKETSDHFLFAHYLWNASLQMAEFVSQAEKPLQRDWDLKGETVLEVGAGECKSKRQLDKYLITIQGAALAGIIGILSGARSVTISDYPTTSIIDNIHANVDRNVPESLKSAVTVEGHQWGMIEDDMGRHNAGSFTRILCADCIWMLGEHSNLLKTLDHFLAPVNTARIWLIAGFHTGRDVVKLFLDLTFRAGFEIEKIWEQDTHGKKRPWSRCRKGLHNDIDERRKWLLVTILRRRDPTTLI